MTKREMYNTIATINADNAEIVEFCHHQIELLDAKKTSARGMTATQKANLEVKDAIMNALVFAGEPITITELISTQLQGYTCQKISALLTQLIKEDKVVKTMEKKKAYFAVKPV